MHYYLINHEKKVCSQACRVRSDAIKAYLRSEGGLSEARIMEFDDDALEHLFRSPQRVGWGIVSTHKLFQRGQVFHH
jgi:hypothetical protein